MSVVVVGGYRPSEVAMISDHPDVRFIAPANDSLFDFWKELTIGILVSLPTCETVLVNADGPMGLFVSIIGWLSRKRVIIRLGGDPWRTNRVELKQAIIRGKFNRGCKYAIISILNWITFHLVYGVVVVAEHLERRVQSETSIPESRIQTAHTPVDIDQFSSSTSRRNEADDITILTVTNLSFYGKLRGVKMILPAIEELLLEHPQMEYIIAGDGCYHRELREEIAGRFDESKIKAPGYISDVSGLYRDSDILVYISMNDGYPNVVLEGQAAGLPVIANSDFGMVEQIEDGESGILLDDPSPSTLKKEIKKLLNDPEERERLGLNAKEKIQSRNSDTQARLELLAAISDINK